MWLDSRARTNGFASRQSPNTESCMKSRRSDICPSAPRSRTSIFVVSPVLTLRSSSRMLPAPCVHLQVRILAQATDLDERRAIAQPEALLGTAVRPPRPGARDEARELLAGGTVPQRPAKVDTLLRVEAEIPDAVGGQPASVAASAERLGGGRDDAEHRAVAQPVAVGRRGAFLDYRLDAAVSPAQRLEHLGTAHDLLHRPVRRAADVHVLDESHLGQHRLAELDQISQLVVVDAAHDDRVELRAGEPDGPQRGNALEDLCVVGAPCEPRETVGAKRVEAHGDAVQTGCLQRPCLPGEQDAVGRDREIAQARFRGQEADEAVHVAPQERLAPGEPDLVDAQVHEHVGQRADLLEVQDLLARKPDVVLFRHAVCAPQVAAVGDRDPKIPEGPLERVLDRHTLAPATTAGAAPSIWARSHSRTSPAFLTPTSK